MAQRRRRATPKKPTPPAIVSRVWLRRHVFLAIILAAVAVRVVYFVQMQKTVFVSLHAIDQTDMHYYDAWARRIAAGDWLSRSVSVPMHTWHQAIARAHLESHPHGRGIDEAQLWADWLDTPRFYQDPLYPYLIAVTYWLTGADARHVFVWQLALGVLTTALVWGITREYFGERAALFAGAGAVLAAPLLYYEMILLKESTIVFAGLLVVWLIDRAWRTWRWPGFLALGAALGFATLLKSTFALLVLAAVAALGWSWWRDRRPSAAAMAALSAGLLLAFVPLAARNVAVGVPPWALGSTGPLTFAISNQPDYRPEHGFALDPGRIARVMGDAEGQGGAVLGATLRAHSPSSALSLLWAKFDRLWHWYEIPNNEDFYYARLWAPILQWLPVTYWVCLPLAAIGFATAVRRAPTTWPLLGLVGASIVPLILFYVLGRFRTALFAALLPLAGAGVAELVACARARRHGLLLTLAGAAIGLAIWTGRPLPPGQTAIRPTDWMLPLAIAFAPEAQAAAEAGDAGRAADALLQFFRYAPTDTQIRESGGRQVAAMLAPLHVECARLLRQAGRTGEADGQERRAADLTRSFGLPPAVSGTR